MSNKTLKEKFDENADKYDKIRKLIIPCFDDLYNITRNLANSKKEDPKILDLGAGTGLLTKYLLEKFPQGEFTLVDLSEEMLKIAKNRFMGLNNFKYIAEDYLTYNFDNSFDMIISSLSIHHLEDENKKKLYKKAYDSLNHEGIFLNADQVIGPTPDVDKSYQENWMQKIEENNFTGPEKDTAMERMKFDNPATLEDNLKWLNDCGFKDVDVYYKYYNFCIFYGKKFE
ncbi:MAG: methyltransferase domain-containing protein [Methanobacterium sp.]|nr:methyltransferase domain-containing protein [Methanobacterium sp.]